jgi:hypothetical protein
MAFVRGQRDDVVNELPELSALVSVIAHLEAKEGPVE